MAAMKWTPEQERVITERGNNILVSAAAGSGKTAVLVQRILSRVLDPDHPVDIDRLLIVTFTKAAAGEMKERIEKALTDSHVADPDNAHLESQLTLIHNAQITTIDGFCSYVIRNYSHLIGLVPGIRIAEEGEMDLVRADALDQILEEAYADENEARRAAFHTFIETFASGKSDRPAENVILNVFSEAESHPDPEGWLLRCLKDNEAASVEEMLSSTWMKELLGAADDMVLLGQDKAHALMELVTRPDGPSAYRPVAEAYAGIFERLAKTGEYEARRLMLADFDAPALSRKKPAAGENPDLRDVFKNVRDEAKDLLGDLQENYYQFPIEEAFAFQKESASPVSTLIHLVRRLMQTYADLKKKKNLMDFSDLEHFALRILRDENGRTYAAKELAERFAEVMVDEYQDSNYLQEAILTAVSRIEDGEHNYFCVGDVKQSIYRFRQARPELFMEKFDAYRANPEAGVRIDLHRNFRSRPEVVDTVNGIFRQIMRREVGGVEYDDDASLVLGAEYPDAEGFQTEVLPVLTGEEDAEGEKLLSSGSGADKRELEARAIGTRIRKMVGHETVYDASTGGMRPVEYRDIVILLRTTANWSESFAQVLTEMQIPAFAESRSGYFLALEVKTVLNYLAIVDNPEQDIPFTAVLMSVFAGVTAEEMARIRTADLAESWAGGRKREEISIHEAARAYARSGQIPALKEKLTSFFSFYDEVKGGLHTMPLHELIYKVIRETGYDSYAASLPGGRQRQLNLRMLIDKAIAYEHSSYIGLFNFIRYINLMKNRELDFREPSTISESANVVRIYSIHKSKGLEYPVVFVAGISKKFNLMDLNGSVLVHPELGIGSDYVNFKTRVKAPTLRKMAIRSRLMKDNVGEELRVLYVALTRAKQKLILTGSFKDEQTLNGMYVQTPVKEEKLPAGFLVSARSYAAWLIPAFERMIRKAELKGEPSPCFVQTVLPSELAAEEVDTHVRREQILSHLKQLKKDVIYDKAMRELIQERFSYVYPYQGQESVPIEVTVSELKERAFKDTDADIPSGSESLSLYPDEPESCVPDFIRKAQADERTDRGESEEQTEAEAKGGAARGSAYHHAMELLPLAQLSSVLLSGGEKEIHSALEDALRKMTASGRMTEEEYQVIRIRDLTAFLCSGLGKRMIQADREGRLYREQPFVLGVPASEIRDEWPDDEMVFVQGIIDAYFYEDDEIVLVDYKTDYVREAEELLDKYRVQVDQYAKALSRVAGRKIKEKLIWSFRLNRSVAG